jgi:hypothetical protein
MINEMEIGFTAVVQAEKEIRTGSAVTVDPRIKDSEIIKDINENSQKVDHVTIMITGDLNEDGKGHPGMVTTITTSALEPLTMITTSTSETLAMITTPAFKDVNENSQKADHITIMITTPALALFRYTTFKPGLFTRFGSGYNYRPPRLDAMYLDYIHYPHYKSTMFIILVKAILLLYTSLYLLPMKVE